MTDGPGGAQSAALPPCPACGATDAPLFRSREEIARELALRAEFFRKRASRPFSRADMMDLTEHLHRKPVTLHRCRCGVLIREDEEDILSWRGDSYDHRVLRRLHDLHAIHVEERIAPIRPLLPGNAEVLEVGSYAGGFLRVARNLGLRAVGVDVGAQTSRFVRLLGYDVRNCELEGGGFAGASFDAVFVWNCFEQLSAPAGTLREIVRLLRPGGLVVLEVPDGEFYAACDDDAVLAYNGLLAFPHRFGFTAAALAGMFARYSVETISMERSAGVVPVAGRLKACALRERATILDLQGTKARGWIDAVGRLVS